MAVKDKATRADRVREKRDQRPRKRSSKSSHRSQKVLQGTFPPILVRGGLGASVSQDRRKRKSARRRYDIALNNQGAEMRLPSVPTIGFGWRFLSGLLVIALGFVIYMLWYSPFFTVSNLKVAGLVRLTNQEINAVANVIGQSIILVSPNNIEQDLRAAFPELVNVSVDTQVPNNVAVNLVERQPVFTWQQDGQTFWVDGDGVVYEARGEGGPSITVLGSELPSMTTPEIEDIEEQNTTRTIPVELVNAILSMSLDAPENSPLVYDDEYGLGWQDPRGWQVYFGEGDDQMDMKLRVYYKTWKRLKKAGIQPALINVAHVHAPYYRLER
jgi:cell division protein FtsQ